MAMPTITWIVCPRGQGFDYVRVAVMPYLPDLSSNNPYHQAVSSGITANYSFVPRPPWPLEARFELGTTVFDWNPDPSSGVTRQIGFHAALGVQIGLAYWLMRKS